LPKVVTPECLPERESNPRPLDR